MSRRLKARARPSSSAAASCLPSSVISSGGLSTRGQPPSSRTRARTRSGNMRAVFRATKPPMECPARTALSRPRWSRTRTTSAACASRLYPDSGLSESPRPRRSTPTRPRDVFRYRATALKALCWAVMPCRQTTGSGPSPARQIASSTSPGTRSCFQRLCSMDGDYTRRRSEGRVMVIYRDGLFSNTTVLANRYPADLQCRLIILIDIDLQLRPPVVVLTLLWGDPVDLILILRGQKSMRSEESVSGNPIDRRSTTKEDIAVIQEKPSEVLGCLYGFIYVLDISQLTFDGRDPLIDLFFLAIEPLPIYDLIEVKLFNAG